MEVRSSLFIQLLTLLILLPWVFPCSPSETNNMTIDQCALLALKDRITSDSHGPLKNWTISSPICNWIGVTCDRSHGRVIGLNISFMDLVGSIPPELGNLSFLTSFDIKSNNFGGILPEDLTRLRRLKHISVGDNNFTGEVPSWFSSFPQLKFLSLRKNRFTSLNSFITSFINESKLATLDTSFNPFQGEIPKSIGNTLYNLKELSMEGNSFSGFISPSITNMSSLEVLNLQSNDLQGMMPSSIFNISTLKIIAFSGNRLSGFLPDGMCLQLQMLTGLYLQMNAITGHIPSNLSSCSRLRTLALPYNNIIGTIPEDIGSLKMLEYLAIAGNNITGKIPSTMGNLSNLGFLLLPSNQLNEEIPSSICNLSYIGLVDLSNNRLRGTLPNCLGNLTDNLIVLDLSANHFHGPIPTTFTKNCALEALSLRSNQLDGTLPQSMANCKKLKILDVENNKIQDSFPIWLGRLPNFRILGLRSNRFYGTLPDLKRRSWFPELSIFDISKNDFTGNLHTTFLKNFEGTLKGRGNGSREREAQLNYLEIHFPNKSRSVIMPISTTVILKGMPTELSKIQATLTMIDLSNNKFYGNIPYSLGKLTALRNLNMSHNRFTGHIPETLGLLTLLEVLDLSSNHLEGEIPKQLSTLTFMSTFNVSYNNLSGQIPQLGGQFSNFDNNSYLGNFGLCGSPLAKKCKDENEQPSTPNKKGGNENILDGITWQGVFMGYGLGLLIGVTLGILYL